MRARRRFRENTRQPGAPAARQKSGFDSPSTSEQPWIDFDCHWSADLVERPDREALRSEVRQVGHSTDRARADRARTADLENALGSHAPVFFRRALLREPIELALFRLGASSLAPKRATAIVQPFLAMLGDHTVPKLLNRLRASRSSPNQHGKENAKSKTDHDLGIVWKPRRSNARPVRDGYAPTPDA